MKFIPLTRLRWRKNLGQLRSRHLFGARQKDERACSWVAVGDDERFYAKETPDDILALLAKSA